MRFQVAGLPKYFCTERALIFLGTEEAVVISAWQRVTDCPLAYLTFALLAMLDKRPKFKLG